MMLTTEVNNSVVEPQSETMNTGFLSRLLGDIGRVDCATGNGWHHSVPLTPTQAQTYSWSPFLPAHSSKRSPSQSRGSKSPVTGGRPENSVDLHHRNHPQWLFLTSLRNNLCAQTQAHYNVPVNMPHHNLHLSLMHNSRSVIGHLYQPPQSCLLAGDGGGLAAFNGALMSAGRGGQRRNKTGTEKEQRGHVGNAWAPLALQHNKF